MIPGVQCPDSPTSQLHCIWKNVRGPFRSISCTQHTWERYDYNLAGCLVCGAEHICAVGVANSKCPLATLDDGTVGCIVTGYAPQVVRYGCEFQANVSDRQPIAVLPDIYTHVMMTVNNIMYSPATQRAHEREVAQKITHFRVLCTRFLRELRQQFPGRRVCIPVLLAHVLHALRLGPRCPPHPTLGHKCATVLSRCIADILPDSRSNKHLLSNHFIVGLLYLMRQGLNFNGTIWLPKIKSLNFSLPVENHLWKVFKISSKIICEAENEVKSILRSRIGVN